MSGYESHRQIGYGLLLGGPCDRWSGLANDLIETQPGEGWRSVVLPDIPWIVENEELSYVSGCKENFSVAMEIALQERNFVVKFSFETFVVAEEFDDIDDTDQYYFALLAHGTAFDAGVTATSDVVNLREPKWDMSEYEENINLALDLLGMKRAKDFGWISGISVY